jgi:hypothetical protein
MRTAVSHPDRTRRDASGTTISTTLVATACLVLALTGGVVYVANGHGPTAHAASDERTPVKTNQAVATPQPPPDITWELVSGETIPVSLTVGPMKADGPVRYGFAHTPAGAILAALNIGFRCGFTPGDGWLRVTQSQVEPSAGRDVLIKARRTVTDLTPPEGGYGQVAGYRLTDYAAGTARVQVAEAFASGEKQTTIFTVTWRDGDWRLMVGPNGDPGPRPLPIDNLAGFVPLSAGLAP